MKKQYLAPEFKVVIPNEQNAVFFSTSGAILGISLGSMTGGSKSEW